MKYDIKILQKENLIYYLPWIFVVFLYSPVFYQLYINRWESIDYTHAYFILPISLMLAWQKRKVLKRVFLRNKVQQAKDSGKSLFSLDIKSAVISIAGLILFVFGWRQDYLFISTFSLIPLLWGTVRYLYGKEVLKVLNFAIFYLLFLIPPPMGLLDSITIPMRYKTAEMTEIILRTFNYPITREGLMMNMAGNDIFMGAPCSGFRSLITMFALAVVYTYLIKGGMGKKLILIAAVIPFSLLGNLIRVLTLCLITYHVGQEAAEGFFHYFSGAVIFVVMLSSLMFLEYILDKMEHKPEDI